MLYFYTETCFFFASPIIKQLVMLSAPLTLSLFLFFQDKFLPMLLVAHIM